MAGFPRTARLLTAVDFERAFARRPALRGRYFVLHRYRCEPAGGLKSALVPESGDATGPRLGLVIPKKLLKTAVHRNLVKRMARESFRTMRDGVPRTDIVVRLTAKLDPAVVMRNKRAIAADLAALFARALHTESGT